MALVLPEVHEALRDAHPVLTMHKDRKWFVLLGVQSLLDCQSLAEQSSAVGQRSRWGQWLCFHNSVINSAAQQQLLGQQKTQPWELGLNFLNGANWREVWERRRSPAARGGALSLHCVCLLQTTSVSFLSVFRSRLAERFRTWERWVAHHLVASPQLWTSLLN